MKKIVAILSILCSTLLCAQENANVQKLLQNAKHDTERVKILHNLAETLPEGEWQVYNFKLESLLEEKLSAEPGKQLKKFYTRYYCDALQNHGLLLVLRGSGDSALIYFNKSLKLSQETGYKENNADVHISMGRLMYFKGDVIQALNNYEFALKIYTEIGNKELEAFTYNVIADLFKDQQDYAKATEYYTRALNLNTNNKDQQGIAYSLNGLGAVAIKQNQVKEALVFMNKSYNISVKENNLQACAASLNDMGIVFRDQGDYKTAAQYFKRSLVLLEKVNYVQAMPTCLQNLGTVYDLLNQTDSALLFLNRSLDMSRHMGFPEVISYASESLYRIYKKQGKQKEALEMYELSVRMRDSVYNDNNRRQAIRSQFKYEYEKKAVADSLKLEEEKKLTQAKLTQEKTQRYLLISGIILLVLIGFIILQRFKHNQKLTESKLRTKIASDLHDEVGSSLSSISMYAGVVKMNNDNQMNESFMEKIESTSRETIENISDIVWSIQPKNDDFKNVLNKMKNFGHDVTASKQMDFEFTVSPGLEKLNLNIEQRKNLYLIYKESINNAVKYSNAKKVSVTINKEGKKLNLAIEDNGEGMDADTVKGSGNGLQNMKQRAQDIGGTINITSHKGQGTRIQLSFKTT